MLNFMNICSAIREFHAIRQVCVCILKLEKLTFICGKPLKMGLQHDHLATIIFTSFIIIHVRLQPVTCGNFSDTLTKRVSIPTRHSYALHCIGSELQKIESIAYFILQHRHITAGNVLIHNCNAYQ